MADAREFIFSNNATALLAGDVSSGDTSVSVASGKGALFPSPIPGQICKITVQNVVTGAYEIMNCVSRTGDVLFVERGVEGTTASDFSAATAIVQHRITAETLEKLHEAGSGGGGGGGGTVDAPYLTYATSPELTVEKVLTAEASVLALTDLGSQLQITVAANGISDEKIRSSAGLSILGRATNSDGNIADITASSDGGVLRRSGAFIGFGEIPQSSVTGLVSGLSTINSGLSTLNSDLVAGLALKANVATLVNTQHSLTGGGDLSISRTLSLVGDVSTPGANMIYGTSALGVRGWYPVSTGVTDHGALSGLGDDDHPQYHNDARADARYALLGHTHSTVTTTAFKKFYRAYSVNTATPAQLLDDAGTAFTLGRTYIVRAWVSGTGTVTGAEAVFYRNGNTGTPADWVLAKLFERGQISNQIEFYLDPTTGPSVRLWAHPTMYVVKTVTEEYLTDGSAGGVPTQIGFRDLNNTPFFNGTQISLSTHTHAFADITSKPTTLAGYGITDAVQSSTTVATQHSITGGGDLSSNRTLSLVGDVSAPGNSMYYGTNASGVRGWYATVAGGVSDHGALTGLTDDDHTQYHTDARGDARYPPLARTISTQHSITGGGSLAANRTLNLVGDVASPGNNMVYSTNSSGVRGWLANNAHTHAATDITSGTLSDDRLSSNIPRLNAANTFSGTQTTGGVVINGAAGTDRSLSFNTAGSARWIIRTDSTAESGSNAGSNFQILARTDAGASLLTPVTIARATGVVNVATSLTVGGVAVSLSSHTHAASDVTSGTFADARIAASNVTQHQASLGDETNTASTLVRRTSAGYIYGSYINQSSAVNENPTISQFMVTNGTDSFFRKASLLHVQGSLGVSSASNPQFNSLGIGTAGSGSAGEIRATGNVTAFYTSDIRLKCNIKLIESAVEKVKKLRGVHFEWTNDFIHKNGGEDGFFVRRKDVGVIAQEIEAIFPELVADRPDGFKGVKYDRLVAVLIEAVKELAARVPEPQR